MGDGGKNNSANASTNDALAIERLISRGAREEPGRKFFYKPSDGRESARCESRATRHPAALALPSCSAENRRRGSDENA